MRLIKRYGGERLYDIVALAYVTAEQVGKLLRQEGTAVTVQDAGTGADITQDLLTPSSRPGR